MNIQHLALIRSKFGSYMYEALKSVQDQSNVVEQQGNFNSNGEPPVPPPINRFAVTTGPSGEFQLQIEDNGEFGRGNNYWAEHDTTPAFSNPHVIDMGQSRNHSIYLGSQKLYWRAYSSSHSGKPSPPSYHGGTPQNSAVQGGIVGRRAASQGSGTGAPGVGLSGPGPIQRRASSSSGQPLGYNWKAQSRTAGLSGSPSTGLTPNIGGTAIAGGGTVPGSGSGTGTPLPPASATVLASDTDGSFISAPLPSGEVWIGSSGNLPVAQAITGDITVSDTGVVAVVKVNGGTVPASASIVGTNGASQIIAQTAPSAVSLRLVPSTIAALPAAPSAGDFATVNNALAPVLGAPVAGTGTAFAAVCWNGTQWTVFSI